MRTHVYFVRHAKPDLSQHDDMRRGLSPRGMADRALVTDFFREIPVEAVLSSPFPRAVDTVRPLAESRGLTIRTVDDLRERSLGGAWIDDFEGYCRAQWADFDHCLPGGESLRQVQRRNVAALEGVLARHAGQTVVIGSHGTALSTIIHRYDPSFCGEDFLRIRGLMPWIVHFTFEGDVCSAIRCHTLSAP